MENEAKILILLLWTVFVFVCGFFLAKRLKPKLHRRPSKLQAMIWLNNPDGYDEDLFKIDYKRYGEWVRASIAWMSNPQKVSTAFYHVQLLGIVDARIYGRNVEDYRDKTGKWICDSNGVLLRERDMILADLWLLGVYEFIRSVDERYRNKSGEKIDQAKKIIRETMEVFRRVRIPLAKSEQAKGYVETDDIGAPTGCGNRGFGWQLNKDKAIFQRDLSDKFLTMLRAVKPGWLMNEQGKK